MRDGLRSRRPMDNYSYELYTDVDSAALRESARVGLGIHTCEVSG